MTGGHGTRTGHLDVHRGQVLDGVFPVFLAIRARLRATRNVQRNDFGPVLVERLAIHQVLDPFDSLDDGADIVVVQRTVRDDRFETAIGFSHGNFAGVFRTQQRYPDDLDGTLVVQVDDLLRDVVVEVERVQLRGHEHGVVLGIIVIGQQDVRHAVAVDVYVTRVTAESDGGQPAGVLHQILEHHFSDGERLDWFGVEFVHQAQEVRMRPQVRTHVFVGHDHGYAQRVQEILGAHARLNEELRGPHRTGTQDHRALALDSDEFAHRILELYPDSFLAFENYSFHQ